MEIRQMRYFLATAEEMNITRAAEKLHIAQPPLSRALAALEKELGTQLFIRGKRRIMLTAEGALFRHRCEQILALTDKTAEEIRTMKHGISGTLYIGTVEGRGPAYVSEWIAGFEKIFPNVRYNVWDGNMDDIFSRLEKGLIDVAVGLEPYDPEIYEGYHVGREPWAAVIPADHPLAGARKSIPLADLAGQELIVSSRKSRMQEISKWFQDIGAEPNVRVGVAHESNLFELVEKGIGIGIFPASISENASGRRVVVKKIVEPTFMASYVLLAPKERTRSELVDKFIAYVRETEGKK
ncbi:MAG: LysR family transcriptional regulator [Lachnospiraceae bacterium]|jgi:DNA-binding transcriptional LysR family regulator|nr:LysR family transcriptional regulator [Lachnospiraceae bacterium]MCI1727797.1 LysR family transcriptional regulator [Lachnospiraceae bacterium]